MSIFQIHDGRLKAGNIIMTVAEYEAIRPEQPLPGLPQGIVTCRYDSASGTVKMSDGHSQKSGYLDTAQANAILADATLAADLATYRAAQAE